MAGFSALAAADPGDLHYVFTDIPNLIWDPTNGPGEGDMPEFTRGAIKTYQRKVQDILGIKRGDDVAARLADLSDEDQEAIGELMMEAMAELCQDRPSVAELRALPQRAFGGFVEYVNQLLVGANPTQTASATTPSLAVVRSA